MQKDVSFICKLQTNLRLFQVTLTEIRDKVDPVLKSVHCKEESLKKEQDKEHKHDESKSRWERDSKENVTVKEEPMQVDVKK